ncbi:hypothetical protein D9758_003512 [Tetrapyrgos nigripes]|uniref:F-box domain-containing protein n=1 Tax=Tetrapyrgos nigripes TaxID=182062 RepID=A0A8H5LVZ8_9AGAR|nr:hypothetical protein D9758_003512 [Tetrapyrgos nigripes]
MDAQSRTGTIPAKYEMNRIQTLLRSNYGLYTPDPECIPQYLSNTEREMRRNADEILRLEAQIASIRVEQRGLEWRVSRYRSLLAPIRRLAPETLSLIFESFCGEGTTFSEKIYSPPAQISRVCAGWRDLTRRTPTLWSSLRIEHAALKHFSVEKFVSLLTMHLELSQQVPLDLSVSIEALDNEKPARLILEMLFSQSTRWRDVSLDLPNFITAADLEPLTGKLHWLRLLDVQSRQMILSNLRAFEIALSLKVLLCFTIPIGLPWAQISDLTVSFRLPDFVSWVLLKATEVRAFKLHQCISRGEPDQFPVVYNNNLTSLSIMVDQKHPDFHHWFKSLTLPNLTSLHIAGYEFSLPVACTSVFENNCFPSFLSRSSCTITSLSLIDLPL